MTIGIATPAAILTGVQAALALLLLSLHLKSCWSWQVKAVAIGIVVPASVYIYLAIQALLGWPSPDDLPEQFQLHAALVDEPAPGEADGGAIYLWLTPWSETLMDDDAVPAEDKGFDAAIPPDGRPRAFDLPYSRALHQQVQSMQERLARGEMVVGSHEAGQSWTRRFGRQHGTIDLEAPPPPPLPSKEAGS